MATIAEAFPGQNELQELIEKVKRAQTIYASYSQEQVDKIFRAAAIAANKNKCKGAYTPWKTNVWS